MLLDTCKIFYAGAKDVKEGSKKDGKGGGFYFPLTAVQVMQLQLCKPAMPIAEFLLTFGRI